MFASSPPRVLSSPIASQTPAQQAVFLVLLGSLSVLNPLAIDMYLPGFPQLQRSFGVSYTGIELSLTAFFVGMIGGQLIYGPLSDRYGRRRPLLVGLGLFSVGSLGCALAPNLSLFIACRVLQALGGCAGMVTSRAIVRDLFDRQRAAQVFSLLMLVTGLGPILGPTLGGVITNFWGWRAIFALLTVLGVSNALSAALFLPETLSGAGSKLSMQRTLSNYRALLQDRRYMAYVLSASILSGGMFAYITGSAFVFVELYHVPSQHYGWIFGTNALGLMLAAQVNRYLLKTRTIDSVLRQMIGYAAVSGVVLGVCVYQGAPLWLVMLPLFAYLTTLGFVFPNSSAGALSHQPRARAATAAALHGIMQWSMALVASIAVSQLHDATARPMAGVITIAGLLALGISRWLTR